MAALTWEEFREIERLKELKARYFRLLDTHQWAEFANCFTSDLHLVIESGLPLEFTGRDTFISATSAMLEGVQHVHHGHMPEITLTGPNAAAGIWAMYDHLIYPDRIVHGYGHYHETYRLEEDGEWRIATLRLSRLIYESTPALTGTDLAQQLWDIEQIKQLKARYFRLMDTKDWQAWQDLFTEDCTHHLPAELNAPPQDNTQYLELVPAQLADAFTTHHGHMPEITLLSPTEARGVWAMFDYVLYPDRPTGIKGYGHYHETYRKCADGKWRISSKSNVRLRLDEIPNPA